MKNYIFICFGLLFIALLLINKELIKAKKENDKLKTELKDCNELSFERFQEAVALSDICDQFQSSRNAKNKYICQKK